MDITGLGSLFDFGGKVIDKIFPDKTEAAKAKLKMFEMAQAGEFKALEADLEFAKQQTEINKEEAKSNSLFVSGWRPGAAWVCVAAMGVNYLVVPLVTWVSPMWGIAPPSGRLDMGELMYLLTGMLGLGGLRTYEKLKGVSSK